MSEPLRIGNHYFVNGWWHRGKEVWPRFDPGRWWVLPPSPLSPCTKLFDQLSPKSPPYEINKDCCSNWSTYVPESPLLHSGTLLSGTPIITRRGLRCPDSTDADAKRPFKTGPAFCWQYIILKTPIDWKYQTHTAVPPPPTTGTSSVTP